MKFLLLGSLFVMSNAFATMALEDGFSVDPELKKSSSSKYEEKGGVNNKVFKVNNKDEFKVTKGKEHGDKLDVYQMKIEKKGSEIQKIEKVIEFDKKKQGKIESLTKCENVKCSCCQTYTHTFCDKLLKEDKVEEKFNKDGEEKALTFYKNLYVEKDAFGAKADKISKLQSLNDISIKDVGEKPNSKEIEQNIKPIYASAEASFKKDKIKADIAECKLIANDLSKPSEVNNEGGAVGANAKANKQ